MVQAPTSMTDFMNQANDFIQTAKADGVDDNRIANTIKFMYGLTQQNISNQSASGMSSALSASDFGLGSISRDGSMGGQVSSGVPQFDWSGKVDKFPGGVNPSAAPVVVPPTIDPQSAQTGDLKLSNLSNLSNLSINSQPMPASGIGLASQLSTLEKYKGIKL